MLYCTVLYCTVLYCTVLARFHRDGFLVLRSVLAPATIATLNSASADLRTNKTLHCQMAYYNGPPIFHKVCISKPVYCTLNIFPGRKSPKVILLISKSFYPPAVQYPHFCMWPDKVHDHFRDGLYHSPLSYVASRYCTVLY